MVDERCEETNSVTFGTLALMMIHYSCNLVHFCHGNSQILTTLREIQSIQSFSLYGEIFMIPSSTKSRVSFTNEGP